MARKESGYFLAYRKDEAIAGFILGPSSELPQLMQLANASWVDFAFVDEQARDGGIGTALLSRAVEWSRERGYERMMLDYFSANILGARFWNKHGFMPAVVNLERRIDERIAWATGEGWS